MKRTLSSGFLIAVIFVFLVTMPGLAREAPSNPVKASANPATSPWFTGWADKGTSSNVGSYPSIAYNPNDNLPYISYYDYVNGNLMLTSPAAAPSGCGTNISWWCRVVDGNSTVGGKTNGAVGQFSSIAFWEPTGISAIRYKLGISYHDATNLALKAAVWTQTVLSGGSWAISTITSTDSSHSGNDVGAYTSLKFTSGGTPYIAYYSHIYSTFLSNYVGSLYLAKQVASGGNCGVGAANAGKWQCDLIELQAGTGMGQYASLGLGYNNVPYMSYYDAAGANLRYAHYAGPGTGTCFAGSDYDCTTIVSTGDVGRSSSLTAPRFFSDVPRIAYYDRTSGYLKYAQPSSSGTNCGGGTWFCGNVEFIGANMNAPGISMTLDNMGRPIIAYENASVDLAPSKLNIARPYFALDLGYGNCGESLPGYLFTYWQCNTIDSASYGAGNVNVAAYTSVAVSPSGLATIAYLESDDYNLTDFLKVAYQKIQLYLPLIKR